MSFPPGVTYQQIASALDSTRTAYPNATTVAEFRPNSLTLHFHYLTRGKYAKIAGSQALGACRHDFESVEHELTHWSDQISSVWGQDYILALFDAYDAAESQDEEKFCRTIDLFDEERRIILPLYYHVVERNIRPHDVEKRWRIEFTAGQEFGPDGHINSARPIFFVVFGDNETGKRVARQPITVGALLETTATWAELRVGLGVLSSMAADERSVEQVLWSKERSSSLYDVELTVYTAPVHMFAKFTGTTDVLRAYERSATLAHIALNLTGALFDNLRHPAQFAPFGERQAAFLRVRNRGYAFAVLAHHASNIDIEQPISDWVGAVLRNAGLPTFAQIMHQAYIHIEKAGRGLAVRSPLDSVRDYLLEIGRSRFLSQSLNIFSGNTFVPLGDGCGPMPLMFDANAELFAVGEEHLDQKRFDPEAMFYAESRLRDFTNNFLQGCRGLEQRAT